MLRFVDNPHTALTDLPNDAVTGKKLRRLLSDQDPRSSGSRRKARLQPLSHEKRGKRRENSVRIFRVPPGKLPNRDSLPATQERHEFFQQLIKLQIRL
jgi:hypothetical protein